jgi:hypothetical protein
MPGKKKTPDQSAQAVILREAGYSISAIASRLDISVSTAQRILKTNKVVAGTSSQALIERAREEMLNTAFALEEVQRIAAASVLDDLALTQQIRLKLSSAVEQLDPADPGVFRGLAASATTLKLTQDVTRRALPLEQLSQALEVEALPELQIHIMGEYDVAKLRAEQRREEAELDGDTAALEDEIETIRYLEHKHQQRVQAQQTEDDDIIIES